MDRGAHRLPSLPKLREVAYVVLCANGSLVRRKVANTMSLVLLGAIETNSVGQVYRTRHHEFYVCKRRLRVLPEVQATRAAQDPTAVTDGFVLVVELARQRLRLGTPRRQAPETSPCVRLGGTAPHFRRR